MNVTVSPKQLHGKLNIIPSKSLAQRVIICAAFADFDTEIICPFTSKDIETTANCMQALGASILKTENGFHVSPIKCVPNDVHLYCNESGAALRFLLPICGALGIETTFHLAGRLPFRPLSPLREEMERMGCILTRVSDHIIHCSGKLHSGVYYMDCGISSQFISGLLFAMSLMQGDSQLNLIGTVESLPYIQMTQHVLSVFGIHTDDYTLSGQNKFISPKVIKIDGDWSNAAFFLAANALGSSIEILNLSYDSCQGDRAIVDLLTQLHHYTTISVSQVPDLFPILSVVAAANQGATFTNIGRLRHKESDRVESVISMLRSLGINTKLHDDILKVYPGRIRGGNVNSYSDHRIAMSAAIAATVASEPVTITNAHCVDKSYPNFWAEFKRLGGLYE